MPTWRERLEELREAIEYAVPDDCGMVSPKAAPARDDMLDAMVAVIEAAERVAEAADAWNSMRGDQQECHEALAAYRALREKR